MSLKAVGWERHEILIANLHHKYKSLDFAGAIHPLYIESTYSMGKVKAF